MALTSGQLLPLVEVRLYDVDAPDHPLVADRGFTWWSLLAEEWGWGSFNGDALGRSYLEFVPEIGLTCRPFLNPQDTRSVHYDFSGGSWSEEQPTTGKHRTYRLVQYDTTAGIEYRATSDFSLPQNPHFAFSLGLPDSPPDWDSAALPPYVRFEFGTQSGQARWAIQLEQGGAFLLQWSVAASAWQAVADLPLPPRGLGYTDLEEMFVFVRCLRGRIGISTDFGRSYTWHGDLKSPITVASGACRLSGRGGMVIYGLHQLQYQAGTYTSPQRPTLQTRISVSTTFAKRSDEPAGTSIGLADLSSASGAYAQYRATVTPDDITGVPFNFYSAPVLYSVVLAYPVVVATTGATYTTPWANRISFCEVDKPLELTGGRCTFRAHLLPGTTLSGSFRRRKIQVRMGYKKDGTEHWWTVFTGHIRQVIPQWNSFGDCTLEIVAENVLARYKHTSWTPLDVRPLGGNLVNTVGDYILTSEGTPLNSSYRSWHAKGDLWLLPAGLAEDPFELVRKGERKLETLLRVYGYAGLEITATDAGVIQSGLRNSYSATVHPYSPTETSDLHKLIQAISAPLDYDESCTAVLVGGQAENGAQLYAWARDAWAEDSLITDRSCPWREIVQEDVPGTCDQGTLVGRTQDLAYEGFGLKHEPELLGFMNLGISRLDQIEISGATRIGVPDLTRFKVLSLKQTYQQDLRRGEASLSMRTGIRRI